MKRALGFILGAFLLSVVVLWALVGMWPERAAPVDSSTPAAISTPYTSFLTLCSGLPINSSTARIATANCLGRIRGFSDAHALMVKLAGDKGESIQLWCVDQSVSDKQLLDSVIAWTTSNHERIVAITKEYTAVNAGTAIIIAALHSTYPCEKRATQ